MKRFVSMMIAVALVAGCDDDNQTRPTGDWEKLGLDNRSINEMHIQASNLYVATTTGLFRKNVRSSESFGSLGFADKNVEALEVLPDGRIIVSLFDKSGQQPPALFVSNDDGTTWNEMDSNFGGQVNEPILDLEADPRNPEILYASGYYVIAKSTNGGMNWEPVYGDWGGFATGISVVEVNPFKEKEIWAGGQGGIENGFLLRTHDELEWDSWVDLVENPTVVKEISFSDKTASEVLVGFEGALMKTSDAGNHWQTLIDSEETRFFFGICRRPQDGNRIYAGGWLKTSEAQPLILFVSDDGGASWQQHAFLSETYGGILDMQIKREGGKDILFIGLDKGGVYRVTIVD